MFNQILMALKFGAASEFALVKGIELARAHDAELHIFHALDFNRYWQILKKDPLSVCRQIRP
jgi:hypothetical protein